MQFDIITIFPEIFNSYFNESILKIAQEKKKIEIKVHNLRDYTLDKHKNTDDTPYGGGPGMIMQVEPIDRAIRWITKNSKDKKNTKVIALDPGGKMFTQKVATKYAQDLDRIILLCGRYEGFDARVYKLVDERLSIGEYVLSGGELPAMVVTEAVTRLLPGVLGHEHSTLEESYSMGLDYIEYPQYTRPEDYKGDKVPKILLSGDHGKIKEWRQKHRKKG
ncbi:tRNA (guanosine(37)-N1)-methyltransferase TrmD [Patescibacteria group bacterium]|nr:tRNA (guanosine(37)-N1)-methyltransferase TrmD [Patescibacteria group bacterium]MBU1673103.1 tRNA (guanosine(37)-N1)-methyltransferase TrmD [Patescibacteria group bacterium]MBU1963655.1 tRNA (guanosine(37)-N1)-methyltransferase TrmD [Patescibacteria group bacterium]